VNVGHGDASVVEAMSAQAGVVDYVHGTQFTTGVLEAYCDELAEVLPMDGARVYPVSGGSEAVETALKLARAYHLARGEADRHVVIARWGSYHGNTRGALDVGGKEPLRGPYEPWLGQALHVSPPYEYRCSLVGHPDGCGAAYAEELDHVITQVGPGKVAAFIAEPVVGATLAAAVPPDDYWPAIADVCRRHGVLLIADEVMTGFGRTGKWFGVDHWGVRPDILTAGKGAGSGYWPLGLTIASGEVYDSVGKRGFVHGFTYTHHAVGAAVGRAVLARLRDGGLVERSRELGERLLKDLTTALASDEHVGDVRGLGTMIGVEIVADRSSRAAFPRADRATERVVAAAKENGLLLYSSTGHVDGDGDLVMVGPPFTLADDEADLLVERAAAAIGTLGG